MTRWYLILYLTERTSPFIDLTYVHRKFFFHAFYVHNILKNIYWQRIWITFLTFFYYYFCCRRKALLGCRYFRKMNTRTEMRWKVKPIYNFVRLRYRYIKTSRLWFGNFELYFHSIKIHEKSVTYVVIVTQNRAFYYGSVKWCRFCRIYGSWFGRIKLFGCFVK